MSDNAQPYPAEPAQKSSPNEETMLILKSLPNPVLVVADDGIASYVNDAAEVFFGAGATVLKRHHLREFVPFGSPLLSLVEQVREKAASFNEYGIDLGTPRNGGTRLVDVQVSPVIERQGSVLVMFQERTMARQIDRQLNHRNAARSLSAMAAILAHEIKNPLSGIRGAAQLIESSVTPSDRIFTSLIIEESDRICRLVDDMQQFSNNRPIDSKPVNIHTVLNRVRQLAKSGFAQDIKITEAYDPSLPPVPGDQDQLIQVFLNILKNAVEAAQTGSHEAAVSIVTAFRPGVRLSVPGSGAKVNLPLEIRIEDNGPGVPADMLPHLFDPFVTTKKSGTGLGLALVAKIVGDHGGIIECDSQPGKTIFRVLMPLYVEPKSIEKED